LILASARRFNPQPDALASCEIEAFAIRFRATSPPYLTNKPIRDERDHASAVRCKSLARENRA
jgi:hypothetical protein